MYVLVENFIECVFIIFLNSRCLYLGKISDNSNKNTEEIDVFKMISFYSYPTIFFIFHSSLFEFYIFKIQLHNPFFMHLKHELIDLRSK